MGVTAWIILISAAAVILFAIITKNDTLKRANEWATLVQALLTSAAILAAGAWYLIERQALPHADVSQVVNVIPIDKGIIAIEAHVTVRNIGRRMLAIRKIDTKLQEISSKHFDYDKLPDLSNDEYWNAQRPNESEDANQFHFAELRWPVLRHFNKDVHHDIEAGESDTFVATYLMRCPAYDYVRVASEIYNPLDSSGMAWKARTFANVGDVCRPKAEGVRHGTK